MDLRAYVRPTLTNDWLWGGDLATIHQTIEHGIRWEGTGETRSSTMPGFAGIWDSVELDAIASHVLSFTGKGESSALGAQLYADNCVSCHGSDGAGDRAQGAPALNDAIWLYGGTREDIRDQVLHPRHGVMPEWQSRLDPVTIKMLAAYVHSLGGGENFVEAPVEETADTPDATE